MDTIEHRKKVFANFGLAMYRAQCAEQSIMQLLVFFDFFDKRAETDESTEQWEKGFDKSTSREITDRLIQAMNELRVLDKEIEELLILALKKKDWLAHTYFYDRSLDFTGEKGRNKMIEELDDAVSLFNEVEETLNPITKELCEKYGLTQDVVEGIKYEMYRYSDAGLNKSLDLVDTENVLSS